MNRYKFTRKIMERVMAFEKKRSLYFLGKLALAVLVLGSIALFFLWVVVEELTETRSFDLLTILVQDQEIFNEFWQDTAVVFWDAFPKFEMVMGISLGVLVTAIFLLSRKRIGIIRKRLTEIAKYQKKK